MGDVQVRAVLPLGKIHFVQLYLYTFGGGRGAAHSSPCIQYQYHTCMRTGSAKNLMTRGIRKYGTVRYCSISSQSRDRSRSPKSGRLCIAAGKIAERKEEELQSEERETKRKKHVTSKSRVYDNTTLVQRNDIAHKSAVIW